MDGWLLYGEPLNTSVVARSLMGLDACFSPSAGKKQKLYFELVGRHIDLQEGSPPITSA
jgi:hypothetical protein